MRKIYLSFNGANQALFKTLITMKLILLLSVLATVQISANVYSQNAVIKLNNTHSSFGEVIAAIEEQSEFKVFYKNEHINLNRDVSVSSENITVAQLLLDALNGTEIGYTLIDKVIVLSPKNSDLIDQQEVTVSGTVTDVDGEPLAGVNVVEVGTNTGVITDIDGNYTITVSSEDAVLSFSFIGYVKEEVPVNDRTTIDMALAPDLMELDEVVVVGYGSVKKSDVTGALSSVTNEQIEEMPVTNINQALQGRAAGVDIVNTSYGLNSQPEVRIRGNRSITASNDPLYVVDGIPIAGTINDINTGDIESVEILKDASATAIYGSRGANGVVLITTKRGKAGEVNVNLESSLTFTNALRFFDDMSGHDWMEIARDNWRGSGSYPTPYPNPSDDQSIVGNMHENVWESVRMGYTWNDDGTVATRPVTDEEREKWGQVMDNVPDEVPVYNPGDVRTYDWFSEGRNENALQQIHQISVSGGTEDLSAYFSMGYINEEGQGIGEKYQRVSPRLNLDFQALDWLKIGMSTTFNSELTDPGHGLLWGVTNQLPLSLPYNDEGEYLINPTGDVNLSNPIRDEELNTSEDRAYRYLGAYYAEITFLNDFRYKLNVSQDFRQWRNGDFRHELSSPIFPSVNDATYAQGHENNYSLDNLLFYNNEFGVHDLGVTLLQSVEYSRWERNSMYADNLPYNTQLWYRLSSTLNPDNISINDEWNTNDELLYSRTQLASFMGRINYGLMDKYLLTASLRYDGSSVFYKDNQWDYFPSFSVAWKAHNENFMQGADFLSQLKLRFGYGTVGQSGQIPYETAGRLQESLYVFGETPAKGYAPELIQTRDVGWEKTTTTNIGVDFGLFQNRVSGSVELYRSNTSDLLLNQTLPDVSGYDQVRANVGKTRNQGIEVSMTTFNVDRGDFRWETDFTFFSNEEEIVELADDNEEDIANSWFVGEPIESYYTYEYDGIWKEEDREQMEFYNSTGNNGFDVGKIRVKDIDGNDTINTNDRTVVGNRVPDFSGGVTNRFYYKGFELSFFTYFRVGHGIYSRDGHYFTMSARYNTPFKVDYYKPMGTAAENADVNHPAPANTRDRYAESMYFREASFLKIRHITLSYNLPRSLLSGVNINSAKLSVQAFNPLLITDYPFLDPEAQSDDTNNIPPGTSGKGWTFSLKVGF